jgi:hypothetical protein
LASLESIHVVGSNKDKEILKNVIKDRQ